MPKSGFAGVYGNSVLFSEELPYESPQWLNHFTFPPTMQEGFLLLASSLAFVICRVFNDSDCCEVAPHCSFWFKGGNFNQKYLSIYLCISWKEMPLVTSYPQRALSEQEISLLDHFIVRKSWAVLTRSLEMETTKYRLENLVSNLRMHSAQQGRQEPGSAYPGPEGCHPFPPESVCSASHVCSCSLRPEMLFLSLASGKFLAIGQSPKLSLHFSDLPSSVFHNFSHPRIRAHINHYFSVSCFLDFETLLGASTVLSHCYPQCLALCKVHNKCLRSVVAYMNT